MTPLGAIMNVVMPFIIFLVMDRVFRTEGYLKMGWKAWWDRNKFWLIGCIMLNFLIDLVVK